MTISDDGLWPIFKRKLLTPHWQRIESSLTGGGIPDLNGCWGAREVWIELKSVKGGQKIQSFTALQAGWLLKRSKHGGYTWVAVRHRHAGGPRKGPPVDEVLFYPGHWSRKLMEKGIGLLPFKRVRVDDPWHGVRNSVHAMLFLDNYPYHLQEGEQCLERI